MKYWIFMCLAVGVVLNDECIGWLCLLLAVIPPFFSFCSQLGKVIEKENRRIGPCIDEEGFYE